MSFLTFCALFLIPGLGRRPERCRCPSASSGCATPRRAPQMLERVDSRPRPACSAASPTSATTSSATPTRPRTRACTAASSRDIARSAAPVALRHAARHRDRRRPAHGALADPPTDDDGSSWDAARRGVGRPARHARRLRRRRAPRPHVRRAVPHPLPRRLLRGRKLLLARAGGAADHRRAGAALRPPRPRRAA